MLPALTCCVHQHQSPLVKDALAKNAGQYSSPQCLTKIKSEESSELWILWVLKAHSPLDEAMASGFVSASVYWLDNGQTIPPHPHQEQWQADGNNQIPLLVSWPRVACNQTLGLFIVAFLFYGIYGMVSRWRNPTTVFPVRMKSPGKKRWLNLCLAHT